MSGKTHDTDSAEQLQSGTEPGQHLPTMLDPRKSNPESGRHLPSIPDPVDDPETGQQLPAEPEPSRRPVPIADPSMGDEPSEKIA
jgi:hypothetical protein